MIGVETFYGCIETTRDALLIIEAARQNILHRVKKRITRAEKKVMRKASLNIDDKAWLRICV